MHAHCASACWSNKHSSLETQITHIVALGKAANSARVMQRSGNSCIVLNTAVQKKVPELYTKTSKYSTQCCGVLQESHGSLIPDRIQYVVPVL